MSHLKRNNLQTNNLIHINHLIYIHDYLFMSCHYGINSGWILQRNHSHSDQDTSTKSLFQLASIWEI